jgi:hypothetical protein
MHHGSADRAWSFAALEQRVDGSSGTRPQVRFDRSGIHELWLRSLDGMAAGGATLTAEQKAGRERVYVSIRPCGVVLVDVPPPVALPTHWWYPDDGGPARPCTDDVVWGATLEFAPVGPGLAAFSAHVAIGRPCRVPWVAPGAWRVTCSSPYFRSGPPIEVDVSAGRVAPLELVLGAPVPRGDVRVRVVRAAGDFADWGEPLRTPNVNAYLVPLAKGGRAFVLESSGGCGTGVDASFQPVEYAGVTLLEAVVYNVPAGDYELRTFANGGVLAPEKPRVRPGGTVELVLRDAPPWRPPPKPDSR